MSENFLCSKGTRQGCNLSPTLFKVYINELVDVLKTADCHPVKVGSQSLGCLLYADDVVILSESPEGLQTAFNKLHQLCKKIN